MSDTKKHKKIKNPKATSNKMKPYLADKDKGSPKFIPDLGEGTGISKTGKLIAKNANRSRKKSVRQEAKKDINKKLDEL